jgi:hypothetical protein
LLLIWRVFFIKCDWSSVITFLVVLLVKCFHQIGMIAS